MTASTCSTQRCSRWHWPDTQAGAVAAFCGQASQGSRSPCWCTQHAPLGTATRVQPPCTRDSELGSLSGSPQLHSCSHYLAGFCRLVVRMSRSACDQEPSHANIPLQNAYTENKYSSSKCLYRKQIFLFKMPIQKTNIPLQNAYTENKYSSSKCLYRKQIFLFKMPIQKTNIIVVGLPLILNHAGQSSVK